MLAIYIVVVFYMMFVSGIVITHEPNNLFNFRSHDEQKAIAEGKVLYEL